MGLTFEDISDLMVLPSALSNSQKDKLRRLKLILENYPLKSEEIKQLTLKFVAAQKLAGKYIVLEKNFKLTTAAEDEQIRITSNMSLPRSGVRRDGVGNASNNSSKESKEELTIQQ